MLDFISLPAPLPLFMHDGRPVIWPGTVNLLHGPTSTHKSRVAELLASVALAAQAGHELRADSLGFSFHPVPGQQYRVLLADTARNLSGELLTAVQGLLTHAGYPAVECSAAFACTSLLLTARNERFAVLADWLASQRRGFDGHLLLVLDTLNDCQVGYRPNDCLLPMGVAQLLRLALRYNATVLTVSYPRFWERIEWGKAATVLQLTPPAQFSPFLRIHLAGNAPAAPAFFYATYCPTTQGLVRVASPFPAHTA